MGDRQGLLVLDSGAKQVSGGTQQLYQALSATLPQQLLTVNQGLS